MCVCVCVFVCKVQMRVFNTFISSANGHLQRNMLISNAQSLRLHHKTRSLLVVYTFICSVISYLEVPDRNYLVASNEHVHLQCGLVNVLVSYLEVGLETPQKWQKQGENFQKNFISIRDGPEKRTETRQGWENSTTLHYYEMIVGSFLVSWAMHPLFTWHSTSGLGMQ